MSERQGNSSAFTFATYAHVMPAMQPEAAERFMEMGFGRPRISTKTVTRPRRMTNERGMGSTPLAKEGGGTESTSHLRLCLERVRGIEPPLRAWEARVLPLNYTRSSGPA